MSPAFSGSRSFMLRAIAARATESSDFSEAVCADSFCRAAGASGFLASVATFCSVSCSCYGSFGSIILWGWLSSLNIRFFSLGGSLGSAFGAWLQL